MRLAFFLGFLVVLFAAPVRAQQAPDTLRATHGDWQVHCGANAGAVEECFMFQAVDAAAGERVMTAIVVKPVGEMPLLRITVPLGVLLPGGLNVSVDGQELGTVGYLSCFADGCMTQVNMTPEITKQLKAGVQSVVTIQDTYGQPLSLPFSLTGFTAAWNAL